jgi:peroxiredoxin
MSAVVGSRAPEFTLRDQARAEISLGDYAGNKTLVVFIPFALSGTCTGEMCEIRDNLSQLAELDANVVVLTCDSEHANRTWAEKEGLEFRILSDFWPHGETTKAYGVFNEDRGCPNRATFVLDGDGIIRDIIATDSLGTPRDFARYTEALSAI